jgi:hypothetical protein
MADLQNTTTEVRPSVGELVEQLREAGVDRDLTTRVFECIETERAEAIAKAARLFYSFSGDEGPISPGEFSDQLNNMSRRLWGISAAVSDIAGGRGDVVCSGAIQLVDDAAKEMERLAEAFEAEHWIARHQGAGQ